LLPKSQWPSLLVAAKRRAAAQYPSRTATIIVPYPPAGRPTRPRAWSRNFLSKKLGQNFIVENVTGASTILATNRLAKALHAAAARPADCGERYAVKEFALRHREDIVSHARQQKPAALGPTGPCAKQPQGSA
jgi:hypothetical protein